MSEEVDLPFAIRMSSDGTAMLLEGLNRNQQPSDVVVATLMIPTMVDMLLRQAEEARTRMADTPPVPRLGNVMQPSDIQLLAPEGGGDHVLRITVGVACLDFTISPEHARALQGTIGRAPQATRPDRPN